MKRAPGLIRLLCFVASAIIVAALTGRLTVHLVNDSPSYLEYPFDSLTSALLSIRTPGYPLFLAIVTSLFGLAAVPFVQVTLHAVASWALSQALITREMSARAATACGICVLFGCTAADHINTVSTDAMAASLGVLTAAMILHFDQSPTLASAALCVTFAAIAIFVRPAYLFLVPWIVIIECTLSWRQPAARTRILGGLGIAGGVAFFVFAWIGLRGALVSDFGIAPFGHQNLSAVMVQTVSPKTLRSLPGESGQLGRLVADRLEEQGFVLPERDGGSIATMTLEQQWGKINYFVVWPIAREEFKQQDTSNAVAAPVLVHRRLAKFNRDIFFASPMGYARWLVLAVRRSVWGSAANIAMHPFFFVSILSAFAWLTIRSMRRLGSAAEPPLTFRCSKAWSAFAIITVSYAVMKIGFVVLTSPPIGRFADAGAIFFPALAAAFLFECSPAAQPIDSDGN